MLSNPTPSLDEKIANHFTLPIDMDQLICPVNRTLMFDPITTPCGHNFDVTGLSPSLAACPICRESIMDMNRSVRNTLVVHLLDQFYSHLSQLPEKTKEQVNENLVLTSEIIEHVVNMDSDTLDKRLINIVKFQPKLLSWVLIEICHKSPWYLKKVIRLAQISKEILNEIQSTFPYQNFSLAFYLASDTEYGLPILRDLMKSDIYIDDTALNYMECGCSPAYLLASDAEGIYYLDNLLQQKVKISNDTLNAMHPNNFSIAFLLSSEIEDIGIAYLAKLMKLGVVITHETLNKKTTQEDSEGMTAGFSLSCSPEGVDILLHLLNFKAHLSKETLNNCLPEGPTSSISPAHYLVSLTNGVRYLHELMQLDPPIYINQENLNLVVPSGELKDFCIAHCLFQSPEGMDLLFKLMKVGVYIKPETLATTPRKGLSFALALTVQKGIELLGELAKINNQYKLAILKDAAVVSSLKESKEGLELLKLCNIAMENSVVQNGIFKPLILPPDAKAVPFNNQENSTSNAPDSKNEKICGKRKREDESEQADQVTEPSFKKQRNG